MKQRFKRVAVPVPARRPTFREKYAALLRHRDAEPDTEHADHGIDIADLVLDEMSRQPVPNRAMRRGAGERSAAEREEHPATCTCIRCHERFRRDKW